MCTAATYKTKDFYFGILDPKSSAAGFGSAEP